MEFEVSTDGPTGVHDVTDRVAAALPDDADGVCTVFVPHTTAGVTVNEAETGLLDDVTATLADLVPDDGDYAHDRIDDNAAAHLRSTLVGSSATVPVADGALALGTWQSILLVESDGPRTRRVTVTVA